MKSVKANVLLAQKNNFYRWLKEWKIEKHLSGIIVEEEETPCLFDVSTDNNICARIKKTILPFVPDIKVGQIRLFSPSHINSERPRYFTIIDYKDGKYLIGTYSIFSSPALPGEFITGREHFSFRVLQIWDNIRLPKDTIEKSWLIDEMSKKELKESLLMHEFLSKKTKVPDSLLEKAGFPLIGINDPRIEYRKAEMAVFNMLKQTKDSDIIPFPVQTLSLAAKDKKGITTILYSIPGNRLKIQLYCDKKRKAYCFDVIDLKGEKSWKLDGSSIQSGMISTTITSGYAELDMERCSTGFNLNDKEGNFIALGKISNNA